MYVPMCTADSQREVAVSQRSPARCSATAWGGRGTKGREVLEGEDVRSLRADSHCCMVGANTTLYSNYPPVKDTFFKVEKIIGQQPVDLQFNNVSTHMSSCHKSATLLLTE